jgi:thiol:disulfide interchange protein DsbC
MTLQFARSIRRSPMDRFALASLCAVALFGMLLPSASFAQTQKSSPKTPPADPRTAIAQKIGDLKVEDVRLSPVKGVYEISRQGVFAYVSADARYVIAGDLYDLDTDANLTENRRRVQRQKLLGDIPEAEMIVFAPREPKYFVTVFTDIDCGFCQRMHSQIADYNRLGIAVRYLLYPRSGPKSDSWEKAERVWCAADRKDALTRAKKGEAIKSPKCPAGVIQRDYDLGHEVALRGTPAIVLPSGEMLPGYAPPADLLAKLRPAPTR